LPLSFHVRKKQRSVVVPWYLSSQSASVTEAQSLQNQHQILLHPIYSHFHHVINPYPSLLGLTIRYIYSTTYPSRPNMHHSIANTTTMTPGTFVPMDGPSMVQDSVSSINSIPGRSILLGVILVVNSVWLLGKAIMIVGWGNDNGSDAVTGTFPHACLSDLGICHSSRLKRRS
jgi:hypothetical protein